MDTNTTPTTHFLELGEPVQHDGYTMREAGTIVLGKTTFAVRIQELEPKGDYAGSTITWLTGPRGADYTLEPVHIAEHSGVYRIMSFKSGKFLQTKSGKEVRVVMLGNVVEVLS